MLLSALVNRIKELLEIQRKINEARKYGRYLVTITYQKDKNSEKLEHFWTMKNFPTKAIAFALSFIYNQIDKKEILFHDLLDGEKKGWKSSWQDTTFMI